MVGPVVVERAEQHAVPQVGPTSPGPWSIGGCASHQAAGMSQPSARQRRSRITIALRCAGENRRRVRPRSSTSPAPPRDQPDHVRAAGERVVARRHRPPDAVSASPPPADPDVSEIDHHHHRRRRGAVVGSPSVGRCSSSAEERSPRRRGRLSRSRSRLGVTPAARWGAVDASTETGTREATCRAPARHVGHAITAWPDENRSSARPGPPRPGAAAPPRARPSTEPPPQHPSRAPQLARPEVTASATSWTAALPASSASRSAGNASNAPPSPLPGPG